MTKEEYAKFHYLLAKLKYEQYKLLPTTEFPDDTLEVINCIELVEKICIIEKEEN